MFSIRTVFITLLMSFVFCVISIAQGFEAYANYDFVPGDTVIFEDDFSSGRDGEFPPMWKLTVGQAVVNKINGAPAFVLTDGSYGFVTPRIKKTPYLGTTFTVECDYMVGEEGGGIIVFLQAEGPQDIKGILVEGSGAVTTHYFPESGALNAENPDVEKFTPGSWHHLAIAWKEAQVKCYIDQRRVLVLPEADYSPGIVSFGGVAPVVLRNVRIALGGGMNMLDQIYKDGKIITHGILFDIGKATLKPQSMGVLNGIVGMLKQDATLKLSVEGHTDSDGDDKANQKLSEERAAAVKDALVKLGVEAGRLQVKGFGETMPIAPNTTPEGKANNRRVEFCRIMN